MPTHKGTSNLHLKEALDSPNIVILLKDFHLENQRNLKILVTYILVMNWMEKKLMKKK